MLDRDIGKSTAERRAILAQNPLALMGLDTLWELGYGEGYDTEPLSSIDHFKAECYSYTPTVNLLGKEVVGIVAKPVKLLGETQWELYAGIVEIPRIFNTLKRVGQHVRDLWALVNPENRVEPALLDQRVRELGGLAPREQQLVY